MSRSVQLDFDKLRNPQAVYLRQGEVVTFIGTTIPMTEEQVFGHRSYVDGRYRRTTEPYNVSPTNEDWAKYHQAKRACSNSKPMRAPSGPRTSRFPAPSPRPSTATPKRTRPGWNAAGSSKPRQNRKQHYRRTSNSGSSKRQVAGKKWQHDRAAVS